MRLNAPCDAIEFSAHDIYKNPISLNDYKNKAVILCFFRDVARPLRNKRVFELTRNYKAWKKIGVEVIVVFSEWQKDVLAFFKKHPRPFSVIADPDLELYSKYGVERVIGKSTTSPILKFPRILDKLFRGNLARLNPVGRIMPAEFLINFDGVVVESWYGRSELDHIPLKSLERFVMAMRVEMRKKVLHQSRLNKTIASHITG